MAANTYSGGAIADVGSSGVYVTVDGEDVGLLLNPAATYQAAAEYINQQFGQDSAPRESKIASEEFTLDLVFAESAIANLQRYFPESQESGGTLYWGGNRGTALTTYEICVYFLHGDGHALSGKKLKIYKAEIRPNGSIEHNTSNTDFEGIPVQIRAVLDTSKDAGKQLLEISPVDATAPAVSSNTPVDGASGQADDVALTVTFDKAIGEGTVKAEHIIVAKSDFSAFVTPSSLSLNAAKTVLTIGHADFTAGASYVVILTTGIRASDGVPLAAPHQFDFTISS